MNIPCPFSKDDTVLTVELDRPGVCVNNDHLAEGPVQVRQILGEEESQEGREGGGGREVWKKKGLGEERQGGEGEGKKGAIASVFELDQLQRKLV